MVTDSVLPEAIVDALSGGQKVITPNRRIAKSLSEQHAEALQATGASVFLEGETLSVDEYLNEQLERLRMSSAEHAGLRVLPDSVAKIRLQRIIENHGQIGASPASHTAKVALKAFNTASLWGVDYREFGRLDPERSARAVAWLIEFEAGLKAGRFILSSQRPALICEAIDAGLLPTDHPALLYNFDDIAPMLRLALEKSFGSTLTLVDSAVADSRVGVIDVETSDDEIMLAARYAREVLLQNPTAKIGVVDPQLGTRRNLVERMFNRVFDVDSLSITRPHYEPPFNITAGLPLSNTLVGSGLLDVLRITTGQIERKAFLALARNSLIFGDTKIAEAIGKAARSLRSRKISLQQVAESCGPKAKQALQGLLDLGSDGNLRSVAQWTDHFHEALCLAGFNSRTDLVSYEYQQMTAMLQQLASIGSMDGYLESISLRQYSAILAGLMGEAVFHAESHSSSVSILGMLEAAGQQFTHLFVLGMTDDQWPATAEPNPFIPAALQRSLDMPNASAERELRYAEALTRRFASSASEVVFSWAYKGRSDRVQAMSPLIRNYPAADFVLGSDTESAYDTVRRLHAEKSKLSTFRDETGLPYSADGVTPGGASLFTAMAQCPFKGMARWRLGVKEERVRSSLIDPAERSTADHLALELLGRYGMANADWLSMDTARQAAVLSHIAKTAIETRQSELPHMYAGVMTELETSRLQDLLDRWIALERTRKEFAITAVEQRMEVTAGGLTVEVRVDLVTETAKGIQPGDHKRTAPSMDQLIGPVLLEPQIPLACRYFKDKKPVTHVSFNRLKKREMGHVVIGDDKETIPGTFTSPGRGGFQNMEALLAHWEQELDRIGGEFMVGNGSVKAVNIQACHHCEVSRACRVKLTDQAA